MNLYVVRHGQTDGNIKRVIDGIKDIPLNNTGKQQAIDARKNISGIDFDIVFCSPLIRTRETMELLTENKFPVQIEKQIIERDCGELMGRRFDEINLDKYWNYYDDTIYDSVENIQDFFRRIHSFLDYLNKQFPDKTILLVTHGGVSKAIECYFNGIPSDGNLKNIGLNNCEVKKYTKKVN